jgi:cytidylate kinase
LAALKLGYCFLDEEIVNRAARLAGVPSAQFAASEQRRPFAEKLLGVFANSRRDGGFAEHGAVDPSLYRFFVDRVVIQAAHGGNCVIAGHSAQVTLAGRRPQVCNVLLYGTPEGRAERLRRQHRLSAGDALAKVRRSDEQEAGYLRSVYRFDMMEPGLYDLMLNTDNIADFAAAEIIVNLATCLSPQAGAPLGRHRGPAAVTSRPLRPRGARHALPDGPQSITA